MQKFDFSKAIVATGNYIATNKKPILYIGGALVVVAVGISITKGLKGKVSDLFNPFGKAKGRTAFAPHVVDGTKVTMSEAQAQNYANNLLNAMKDQGTDEAAIRAVMTAIKNGEDYKLIYNKFETKSYYANGEPTISAWLFGWADLDMNEWFRREISKTTDFLLYKLIREKAALAGMVF